MKNNVRKLLAIIAAAVVMAFGFTGCDDEYISEQTHSKTSQDHSSKPIIFGTEPDPEESVPFIEETPSYAFSYYYDSDYDGMVVDDYFLQSPKVRIPDTLEGAPVTRVSMQHCQKNLTHLFLPETVKSIWLSGETKKGLEYINVPRDMTYVGGYSNCYRLESIVIPDGATEIGYYAFSDCESLTSVTIPDSVTEIRESAFGGCTSLKNVTYKGETYDYEHIEWLYDTVNLGKNGMLIEDGVLLSASRELTEAVIPDNVTEIGNEAFRDCKSLISVTIPYGVTKIGSLAFLNCENLTSITIPDSVTRVDSFFFGEAFWGCTSLTNATFKGKTYSYEHIDWLYDAINIGESGMLIEDGVLLAVSREFTEMVIPDNVTEIGDNAFRDCRDLISVTIPYGVTRIGKYAFQSNTSLTSVTIPNSVTEIGTNAFEYNTSLTSVTIPDSMTTLGDVFQYCTSLTSVTLPSNIEVIGCAFENCPNVQVNFRGKIYDHEHLYELRHDSQGGYYPGYVYY